MKTYSDLQDIEQILDIKVTLEPVGSPQVVVSVQQNQAHGTLSESSDICGQVGLMDPITVQIELLNKDYQSQTETAVKIRNLQIDGIDLVPRFTHLATYVNDKNNTDPTSYLGFNGKWTLTIDRPFYQWLHQATGQGWLLS